MLSVSVSGCWMKLSCLQVDGGFWQVGVGWARSSKSKTPSFFTNANASQMDEVKWILQTLSLCLTCELQYAHIHSLEHYSQYMCVCVLRHSSTALLYSVCDEIYLKYLTAQTHLKKITFIFLFWFLLFRLWTTRQKSLKANEIMSAWCLNDVNGSNTLKGWQK